MALDHTVVDSSDSDAEESALQTGNSDKMISKQRRMESYSTTVWLSLWLAFEDFSISLRIRLSGNWKYPAVGLGNYWIWSGLW